MEKGKGPRYVFLILVENEEKNIIGKKNGVNCCIHCLVCKKEPGRQNSKEMCVDGPPILALIIGSKCNQMMCDGY